MIQKITIIFIILLSGVVGYFIGNNRLQTPNLNNNIQDIKNNSSSINTAPDANNKQKTGKITDVGPFSISLPSGRKYKESQGTDSQIGTFIGDNISLYYDFGYYSNSLADEKDPNHIVTYEQIDGYNAKIVVPKITGQGIVGIYFADLGGEYGMKNTLQISSNNLTENQQKIALQILRTVKIKNK